MGKRNRKFPGEGLWETRVLNCMERVKALSVELDEICDDDNAWKLDTLMDFFIGHALESAAWMVGRAMFRDGVEVTEAGIRENLERIIRNWFRSRKSKPAEHWEMAEWHVLTAKQNAETYLERLNEEQPSEKAIVELMLYSVDHALGCCSDIVDAVNEGRWTKA